MILSEENKGAVRKYKSIEKNTKKIEENLSSNKKKLKKLLESIPYPIFVKESENVMVAYLSISKKIQITKSDRPSAFRAKYAIEYNDVSESTFDKTLDIKLIEKKIKKKEFIDFYQKAQSCLKEAIALSMNNKKVILCEKIIVDKNELNNE